MKRDVAPMLGPSFGQKTKLYGLEMEIYVIKIHTTSIFVPIYSQNSF